MGENNKIIGLIKLQNNEMNIFEEKDLSKLKEFISIHKKGILFKLNSQTMNKIFGLANPVLILFL